MPYIWQEYSKNTRFLLQHENVSPYMEVWNPENRNGVAVNPILRIHDRVFPYEDTEDTEKNCELVRRYADEPAYQDIFNLIMHEIAQTDRLTGADLLFILGRIEKRFLLNGRYGEECAALFQDISPDKQEIILRYLAKYDLYEQRTCVFDSVLSALYQGVRMYYERSEALVHIYIPALPDTENRTILRLVTILFNNIGVATVVTWNEHFGIIGYDDTMKTDHIQII